MEPTKRRKCEASFRLKVIQLAKTSNNCAAARTFNVTEKMVRDWRMNEDNLRNMSKEKCAMRRGSTHWPQLEDHVAECLSELRQDGYIVTQNMIRAYALQLARDHKFEDFKATSGWCSCFMNRRNLVIRHKAKIAQWLPRDLDHKVTNPFVDLLLGWGKEISILFIVSETQMSPIKCWHYVWHIGLH